MNTFANNSMFAPLGSLIVAMRSLCTEDQDLLFSILREIANDEYIPNEPEEQPSEVTRTQPMVFEAYLELDTVRVIFYGATEAEVNARILDAVYDAEPSLEEDLRTLVEKASAEAVLEVKQEV